MHVVVERYHPLFLYMLVIVGASCIFLIFHFLGLNCVDGFRDCYLT